MTTTLSDVVCLAVELRRLQSRVDALEARIPNRHRPAPRLNERVLEMAAKRSVVEGREIIRALMMEGALDHCHDPTSAAWMAILREARRGRLRRVGRGKYSLVPEAILNGAQ